MLGGKMTNQDGEEVEDELEALEREVPNLISSSSFILHSPHSSALLPLPSKRPPSLPPPARAIHLQISMNPLTSCRLPTPKVSTATSQSIATPQSDTISQGPTRLDSVPHAQQQEIPPTIQNILPTVPDTEPQPQQPVSSSSSSPPSQTRRETSGRTEPQALPA